MPLPDDADEKWVLREHTEVKHKILRKYFTSWTRVLSSTNDRIHYFDGFAGRGRYEDGQPGSPLVALDAADRNGDLFEEMLCTFVELNESNHCDLQEAVDEKKSEIDSDNITVKMANASFEEVVEEIIEELNGNIIVPSFFFVDPFGYNSMPFETVSELINLRDTGVELFLTFMIRDIRRFLNDEGHENSITRILGTEEWKNTRDSDDKEEEILKIYENQLKQEAGVRYVWPFEMKLPERRETVYYLIHATNHFKGFKIMKDVMFNAGAEDRFAYLGPDHYAYDDSQATLFDTAGTEDGRIENLATYLFDQLEGEEMSFWEVMKQTYTETDLIEKHYRDAIYLLEERHKVTIKNQPNERNGTESGLQQDDTVLFQRKYGALDQWI